MKRRRNDRRTCSWWTHTASWSRTRKHIVIRISRNVKRRWNCSRSKHSSKSRRSPRISSAWWNDVVRSITSATRRNSIKSKSINSRRLRIRSSTWKTISSSKWLRKTRDKSMRNARLMSKQISGRRITRSSRNSKKGRKQISRMLWKHTRRHSKSKCLIMSSWRKLPCKRWTRMRRYSINDSFKNSSKSESPSEERTNERTPLSINWLVVWFHAKTHTHTYESQSHSSTVSFIFSFIPAWKQQTAE